MIQSTTDSTFEADVLNSKLPVYVDFWATWCGPCKMVGPILEEVSKETSGKALVFKVDIDSNPSVTARYAIHTVPTVILFNNGGTVKQLSGVYNAPGYLLMMNLI